MDQAKAKLKEADRISRIKKTEIQDQIRRILQEIQDADSNWRLGQIMHWVMTELRGLSLFYVNDDTMLSGLKKVRQLLGIARTNEPIPFVHTGLEIADLRRQLAEAAIEIERRRTEKEVKDDEDMGSA